MNSRIKPSRGSRPWWCIGTAGAATVELAVATPVLLTLVLGGADLGHLLATTQSVAAATRIGAQVARNDSTCQSGISVLTSPQVGTTCRDDIRTATQNARQFSPALTFPSTFPLTCYCADANTITCSSSCAGIGRPGPNSVFITVTATQTIPAPMFPWPGYPATVTGKTELRLQ